jgi:hypothetical protein
VTDSTPPRAATATRPDRPSSTGSTSQRGGLSILDAAAWHKQSKYSQTYGPWTICAVKYRGDVTYELWKNSAFYARDRDAQTLRVIAAAGGVT